MRASLRVWAALGALAVAGCAASVAPSSGDMANVKAQDMANPNRDLAAGPDLNMSLPDLASEDFAMCLKTCSRAGQVSCASNHATTCMSVDGCLQLGPSVDCGPTGLCCATGCVAIDENNCGQCGGTCGGRTPACGLLNGSYSCVCTGAACATVQLDCNTLSGQCQTCFPVPNPENRTDFWVDGAASIPPTGSQGCPYPTITQALAVAATSTATAPKTIHIAPGTYGPSSTNPETFPLVLRNGTSLVGAGAGVTILSGTAAYSHASLGGAFSGGSYQVAIVVGDTVNASTLSGLSVVAGASQQANGNYVGILCDQGDAVASYTSPPPTPYPSPTLVVDHATIGPGFGYGLVCTNTATANAKTGCNLLLTNSTVTGNGVGVWVVGAGTSGTAGPVVAAQIGDLAGHGNTISGNTNNGSGYGLIVWDNSSPVHIYGNTFSGDDWGIAIGQHPLLDHTIPIIDYLDMQQNVLRNLTAGGLNVGASAIIDQFVGNTFTNVSNPNGTAPAYAVQLDGEGAAATGKPYYRPEIRHARNNQFIANDIAVGITGAADTDGSNPNVTDFGNASDPGNNLFLCNAIPSPTGMPGGDVYIGTAGINNGVVQFVGNAWDHMPPTQATTPTNGTDVVVVTGGPMVTLSNATATASPCPVANRPR